MRTSYAALMAVGVAEGPLAVASAARGVGPTGLPSVRSVRRRRTRAAREAAGRAPRGAAGARDGPLGDVACTVLGQAAALVAVLGGDTVANGLQLLRDKGFRPTPAQQRSWRALDAAAGFLRHPLRAQAVVSAAMKFVTGAAQGVALHPTIVVDTDESYDEYLPEHDVPYGERISEDVLQVAPSAPRACR